MGNTKRQHQTASAATAIGASTSGGLSARLGRLGFCLDEHHREAGFRPDAAETSDTYAIARSRRRDRCGLICQEIRPHRRSNSRIAWVSVRHYLTASMIESFKRRGLEAFFRTGRSAAVRPDLQNRTRRRLDALDAAASLDELHQPGFSFHALQGSPQRYSIHVNGPWCITFEWENGNARRVSLEQYH
jgi:toxin HigB-1